MKIAWKKSLVVLAMAAAMQLALAHFQRCDAQEGKIRIAVPSASLFAGSKAVGTASQGQVFEVLQANADWFLISAPVNGQPQKVWVRKTDTQPESAASPQPAPSLQRVLRIKSNTADVMIGSRAVARLRRGEIHPLGKVQGRYYAVRVHVDGLPEEGWLLDTHVEVIPASNVGPSFAGHRPATAVEATAKSDWKNESIVLTAPSLPAGADEPAIVAPQLVPTAEPRASIAMSDDSLTIETDALELLSLLTPGTRSLWISAQTDREPTWHRIDLPTPELRTNIASFRYPTIPDGPVVMVPVTNLLPGFVVEYAPTPQSSWKTLPRQGDVAPRWLDVYQDQNGEHLRIVVPTLADSTKQSLRLRVRNVDGSTSNTIAIDRTSSQIEKTAKRVDDAKPALVESTVTMPDVEVLPFDQAAAQLAAVGLKATPVEHFTLAAAARENVSTLRVVRQGIAAEEPALLGSTVLLTVALNSEVGDQRPSSLAAPIDTADDLGFASLSPASEPEASNLDGAITETLARHGIDAAIAEQATAIAIGSDPGVNLNLQRSQERTQAAGVLRLVIDALVKQPSWRDLPGPVGKAITACIQRHELQLRKAMQDPLQSPKADDLQPFVATLTETLSLSLAPADQEALTAHLLGFAQKRWSPELLDRNQNGLAADDLAVCGMIWLFEQERLAPLSNVVVVPSPGGGNVAVVSDKPHNADWLKTLLPLLFLPGKTQPPAVLDSPATSVERPLPEGQPLVTVRRGPDEVRVPDVAERLVGDAEKRLRSFDLGLANAQAFFQDDRVTASEPEAGKWVPAKRDVALRGERRIPNLLKLSKQQADAEVARYRFRLEAPRDTLVEDVVISQQPASGDYAPVGSAIEVDVAAIVPSVVNSLQRDAAATLSKKGLAWRAETKAFGSDKVVAQSPEAGTLVAPKTEVLLDLYLQMPNVIGRSLDQALKAMEDYDLRSDVTTRLARGGDTVRGQSPAAGTYVPHQSLARLGPVMGTVPNVVGNTIERAQAVLNGGDYPARLQGDLIADDIVTFQTPRAGVEQERGAAVVLDARVPAPNVEGQSIGRAEAIIAAASGRLRSAIADDFERSDVVHSQLPSGGELVYPRSTITLVPGVVVPDVRGQPPDSAIRALAAKGLDGRLVSSGTQETDNRNLVGATRIEGQRPGSGLYRRRDVGTVNLSAVTYILAERVVPRVEGLRVQEAIAAIKRAELTPIIVVDGRELTEVALAVYAIAYAAEHDGANLYDSTIHIQSPPQGTRVLKGSRVRIEIGLSR